MCHLSMKLSDNFDPNQMYTSDKIVVKHISVKETLLKLYLEPKGQGHSKSCRSIKIMQVAMKLSDNFDPNQMYTSDKIVVKHISVKETLLKLS